MLSDDLMPKELFFTKGVGRHLHRLQSFELALRERVRIIVTMGEEEVVA